jgi:hypothetical protein
MMLVTAVKVKGERMTPTSGKQISKAMGTFWRKVSALNVKLVQSTCPQCNSFVGASPSPEVLSLVENMHHCSGLMAPPPVALRP